MKKANKELPTYGGYLAPFVPSVALVTSEFDTAVR